MRHYVATRVPTPDDEGHAQKEREAREEGVDVGGRPIERHVRDRLESQLAKDLGGVPEGAE
jgi:hypothetical protein